MSAFTPPPLCEMCLNTEFFLVRIFSHLDWIRRDPLYLSVFSPNAGKIWTRKNSVFGHFPRSAPLPDLDEVKWYR